MRESRAVTIRPSLNVPQATFLNLPHKFRAFVSGFGSGKTWVGCSSLSKHFWEFPKINAGYFAPTYPQIRDIFYPTVDEVAYAWGMQVKIKETNKEVEFYSGRQYRGTVICRSMEKPESIIGFKIGQALVDELDVMKAQKAALAWRKIIARMRYKVDGLKNGIDVTTTPEGFKFVYEQFVKQVRERPELRSLYGLIQASTYDNEANLPDDYIPSLRGSYPPQLIDAYLDGKFVNLAAGSVYPEFSRTLNHSDATMQAGEPLHIGMDFNVLKMAAVIYVIREGLPIAVDELTGVRDTPAMVELFRQRYSEHAMAVYPDASGQNTSSKCASESDLSILRTAGLTVRVNSTNPLIKDRVIAVNAMILNDKGERRLKVNTDRCPKLTEAFEQQPYDINGQPDKTTGHDHVVDGAGYFIAHRYPVIRPQAMSIKMGMAR